RLSGVAHVPSRSCQCSSWRCAMIRHLLKLVWHRKGANSLVMAEISLLFLIVFAVVTMTVSLWSRWGTPLGFSWNDVWMMEIDSRLLQEAHSSQPTSHI